MPFPKYPSKNQDENLFSISDLFGLRTKVFPLFGFYQSKEGLFGLGTAFRIDTFGNAMTAYHVIEDQLVLTGNINNPIALSKKIRCVGLDALGIGYGTCLISDKSWMNIKHLEAESGYSRDVYTAKSPINVNETAILDMPSNTLDGKQHSFLPIDLCAQVNVGDKVLALGFPALKPREIIAEEKLVTVSAEMSGSFGTVTDVLPDGLSASRPWPTLVVDGDWPSGMSGGPVFNESGNVIGLVSAGVDGQYASARWLKATTQS